MGIPSPGKDSLHIETKLYAWEELKWCVTNRFRKQHEMIHPHHIPPHSVHQQCAFRSLAPEPHSEHRWVSKENIPCWAGALISSLLVYREKVALICHPGNCSRNANQFQDKGKPSRSRGAAWRSSQPRRVLATTPQLTGTFQNHSRNFFFFYKHAGEFFQIMHGRNV